MLNIFEEAMSDLYERLEEIQEMTRMLEGDVALLQKMLGERSPTVEVTDSQYANRRSYVRATFALIEAVVEQHKQLLLALES